MLTLEQALASPIKLNDKLTIYPATLNAFVKLDEMGLITAGGKISIKDLRKIIFVLANINPDVKMTEEEVGDCLDDEAIAKFNSPEVAKLIFGAVKKNPETKIIKE